jgi:hypothetical protein
MEQISRVRALARFRSVQTRALPKSQATVHDVRAKRSKSGATSFDHLEAEASHAAL